MLFRPMSRQIISDLEVEPKLRRSVKSFRKEPRCISRNPPFAFYDFVDTLNRYAKVAGKLFLAQPHWLKIFLE